MPVRNPLSQTQGKHVLERPLPGWLDLTAAVPVFRPGSCADAGQRRDVMRHVTLQRHLMSIQQEGLLPEKSQGAMTCVWLHTPERTPRAVEHTPRRHQEWPEEIILLEVRVPRTWIRRAWRDLWTCNPPVPPARLVWVTGVDA
jgi:hypothetical protein